MTIKGITSKEIEVSLDKDDIPRIIDEICNELLGHHIGNLCIHNSKLCRCYIMGCNGTNRKYDRIDVYGEGKDIEIYNSLQTVLKIINYED